MLLEVHERLALLELLPKESDYAGLKAIRVARENISFTPEEMRFITYKEYRDQAGKLVNIVWDTQKALDAVVDIPIDEYVTGLIRDALAKLAVKKKLTEEYLSVYEKFVVMYK